MSDAHPYKKLESIAHIVMGQSPSSTFVHDSLEQGLPFLQGCAEFGASTPTPFKSCSGIGKLAQQGASLISVRAPVGAINLANCDYIIGRGLAAISARSGVDTAYLRFALQWSAGSLNRVSQGSTFEAVGSKELEELLVPVPASIDEQRGIAEVLSAIDEQIELTEVLVAKSKLRSKGLMADLLSCRLLHPQDVNDVLLSDAVPGVQYGISSSLDVVGVIPVLRMNNLSGGEISVSDLKYSPSSVSSNLLLYPGDVLFNRTNSMEHVGRTSIWRGQLAEATFASYLVRLKPDLRKLMPEYLVYLLEWDVHQLQMRKFATPGVQQVNINPTSLRRCRVCIPKSLAVQRDVVDALDSAREHVSGLRAEATKLRLQKQGLMRDLLTGKVRIK